MYRIKYLLGLMISSTLLFSCSNEVEAPSFDVKTEKQEYKVGDSVSFTLSGHADIITFYSGEKGKEYQFKNRTEASGKLELEMETQVLFGSQPDNLSVLVSTDFNNVYDTTNVRAAKWSDITKRFTLSTSAAGANGVRTSSGKVDISDLIVSGKPLYFAYKYLGQPVSPTSQRTWRVYSFNLTNTLEDNTVLNGATITTAGWIGLDFANPANKWTIQAAAPSLFFVPASSVIKSEDWVVTKALFPTTVTPDLGTGIKAFLEPMRKTFKYAFSAPGVYTVTFVATNAEDTNQRKSVKEVQVTVK
ncbi:DUF5017 domain-containing protein [Desertivirga xinjiangensis]|uniref:DUF5017 domain-containing protein n=1 Tax=Desertivirga xinjiangensis TaxID=539206 RepID=UPI00210DEA70|nr:DUF5017 domain-containing protein [Pedobacter xinjiangensis]